MVVMRIHDLNVLPNFRVRQDLEISVNHNEKCQTDNSLDNLEFMEQIQYEFSFFVGKS